MKIAIEGCAHGELEQIYNSIQLLEEKENVKVDLLICCGDFQSTRNLQDLRCMAVPPKYQDICTFYKYYSGEKTAPILTIFIGGNHEASNYLQELSYGGWVAPNVYYMGYASVVNVAGVRIGGLSGIYKSNDYNKGRFEISPYQESTKRSVYHIRNIDIFRLKQLSQPIDIFISHDWPNEITKYGNVEQLLKKKPFFRQDIESNNLGSPPAQEVLYHLKPSYWFSAHLHCKFAALVPHYNDDNELEKTTKFLALDKCLPRRNFLQIVDIKHDDTKPIEIHYDLEWLAILHYTNHLVNVKNCIQYMPGPNGAERWNFTPTEEEKSLVLQKFSNDLKVPENFVPTALAYNPDVSEKDGQPDGQTNPQTIEFCNILGIDDPTNLFLLKMGKNETPKTFNFIPRAVEIKQSNNRLNISLPEPKITNQKVIEKLNMTLPAPKNDFQDYENTLEDLSENSNNTGSEKQDSTIEKVRLSLPPPKNDEISNLEISNSEIFPNLVLNTSTPQKKKFKRRNESIYNAEEG